MSSSYSVVNTASNIDKTIARGSAIFPNTLTIGPNTDPTARKLVIIPLAAPVAALTATPPTFVPAAALPALLAAFAPRLKILPLLAASSAPRGGNVLSKCRGVAATFAALASILACHAKSDATALDADLAAILVLKPAFA